LIAHREKAFRLSSEFSNALAEKTAKAEECRSAFREFKHQVATKAEYSRSGLKISDKILKVRVSPPPSPTFLGNLRF
jgi:hypothetical protein